MNEQTHGESPNTGGGSPSEETAAALRAAIRSEDYETAGRLMVQLTEAVASRAESGPPEQTRLELAETMHLLLWAKKTVLAHRAHLQARLDQAGRAARYQSFRGGYRGRTWMLRG